MNRYLAPVIGLPTRASHLAAACRLAARDGGQVVALIIGVVPPSIPMRFADRPELWASLEGIAAQAVGLGRELGQEVQTVQVLSRSAGEGVIRLAEEYDASAVCLAYHSGFLASLRRWFDPLWRTVLKHSPRPVVLEPPQPATSSTGLLTELAQVGGTGVRG